MSSKSYAKANSKFNHKWNKLCNRRYVINNGEQDEDQVSDKDEILLILQEEKANLNQVKSLLNSFNILPWHRHTKNTHKFSRLPYILQRNVKAELSTQAWAKFYTILSGFNLINITSGDMFRSIHLCEAPGAFVAALNHFLVCEFGNNLKWEWMATTLNPYYEGNELGKMIPDDLFLIETFNKWDFGTDFTGNVMSIENLEHFKKKFQEQNVQLVTADGSIDCSDAPDEQEATVAFLIFWEVIYALNILSNGGSFVLKIFTIFESYTVVMVYLLTQVFDNVTFFKPGPSKPGNSEVYVVSQNFQKEYCLNSKLFEDFQVAVFKGNLEDLRSIANNVTFSEVFWQSILDYVKKSCELQKEAILGNIETFEKLSPEDRKHLHHEKEYFAKRFIKELGITRINDYVSPLFMMKNNLEGKKHSQYCANFKTNSLNQRKSNTTVLSKPNLDSAEMKVAWYNCDIISTKPCLDITTGKKIDQIWSSAICKPSLLNTYREMAKKCTSCSSNSISQLCSVLSFDSKVRIYVSKPNEDFQNLLGAFFREKLIPIELFTISAEVDVKSSDSSDTGYVFCCLGNLFSEKSDSLHLLVTILKDIQPTQTIVFLFDEIILTNFWLGIFYLISPSFEKILYFVPGVLNESAVFLVLNNCSDDKGILQEILDDLLSISQCLRKSSEDGVDVLHVVPVATLMQSHFREYISECNDYFIQNYS